MKRGMWPADVIFPIFGLGIYCDFPPLAPRDGEMQAFLREICALRMREILQILQFSIK